MVIPQVIKQTPQGDRGFDIFSRLLDDRIIVLTGEINDQVASLTIAQLLYLASTDAEKDIQIYINSPGGSVSAGLAILDTMNFIKPDVSTICVGMAASMGAVLLAGGEKGKRFALPNSEVMIHQPLGGTQGQASDILIAAEHIKETKDKLYKILSEMTGQEIETIHTACDRDNWHSAEKAKDFGLIDEIISKQP